MTGRKGGFDSPDEDFVDQPDAATPLPIQALTHAETAENRVCVGELRLRLYDDETIDCVVIRLGRWTPGRVEKAWPRMVAIVTQEQARAAGLQPTLKQENADG